MATCLLKGVHLLTFLFLIYIIFFSTFFTLAMYKKIKLSFILRGLRLLFLPNVPGATSILESRVCGMHAKSNLIVAYCLPDDYADGLF